MNNDSSPVSAFQRHLPFFHRILCSRRLWKVLGYGALSLVTIIALFYAVENWRGARAWQVVRDDLRAKGEPLSFEELVPPMPRDEENFAMAPMLAELFTFSTDTASGNTRWEGGQASNKDHERTKWRDEIDSGRLWHVELPNPVEHWRQAFQRQTNLAGIHVATLEPARAVLSLLETVRPQMDELEQASHRSAAQFPIRFQDGYAAILPHLATIKRYTILFRERALGHLATSNHAAALLDTQCSLRLAETIKREPLLISGLVRSANLQAGLPAVTEGLRRRSWSEPELALLQSQLAGIDVLAGFPLAIRGERTGSFNFADMLKRKRNWEVYNAVGDDSSEARIDYIKVWLMPSGWLDRNKIYMANLYQQFALPAVELEGRRVYLDRAQEYNRRVEVGVQSGGVDRMIANKLLPAMTKVVEAFALGQTAVDLAETACAVERFRLKTGQLPLALDALVPEFLNAIPTDVMDGKPLRYETSEQDYLLYSIGANGTDDGGNAVYAERNGKTNWQSHEGDWVWSYSKPANH